MLYDAAGNLRTAANGAGAYTFTYDKLNRVTHEEQPFGLSLTYGYDATDNRTHAEDSLGGVVSSNYDPAHRLDLREFYHDGQEVLRVDLAWTDRNQLESVWRERDVTGTWTASGSTSYSYDPTGRLENLQHRDGTTTLFSNMTFGYDAAHRLTSEEENGTLTTFGPALPRPVDEQAAAEQAAR